MVIITVLGGFFGDEGKGKNMASIAGKIANKEDEYVNISSFKSKFSDKEIVGYGLRSNGGPNGGHALHWKGKKVAGHVIPSTIIHSNFVSVVGAGCALHPANLVKEIKSFQDAEFFNGSLIIDDNALIILDLYMILDGLKSGRSSTGSGIRYVYGEKAKRIGIVARDLLNENSLKTKLKILLPELYSEYYEYLCNKNNVDLINPTDEIKQEYVEFKQKYSLDIVFEELTKHNDVLKNFISSEIAEELKTALKEDKLVLNEGSQSYFLGTTSRIENGSSSIIDPAGIFITQNIPVQKQKTIFVVKCFGSRVGNGYFVGEFGDRSTSLRKPELLKKLGFDKNAKYSEFKEKAIELMRSDNPQEKGDGFRLFYSEFGETTGFPRGKAPLDLVALRTLYNNTVKGGINETELWINQMDGPELLDEIPVIVEYEDPEGNKYRIIPSWSDEKLRTLKPVIKVLPSWKNELTVPYESWDQEAKDFIKFIEEETEFKIGGVGNGPNQGALIPIK